MRTRDDGITVLSDHDSGEAPAAPAVVTRGGPFAVGVLVAGKYRIERELAEGGLGVVVVALHEELGQRVAIKYLKPHILARPALVERFKREAQLAASIRSEHVVRVYDVGLLPVAGPYMVMEYLEGEDLGTRLMRGRLPPAEAIDYVVQACDALAEAHSLGIVHRDLKPENLFLARRAGTAPILKILDFGISKVSEKANRPAGAPRIRQMTEEGERFGTPVYMSPEQILATANVDLRTDIWSMGVVLFELLSGSVPFDADSIAALGVRIVKSPAVPLRAVLPTASPALEGVIQKCLEKDPARRYRNVAELVEELVRFAAPSSERRIARIKHVVLAGGDSIRPPRAIDAVGPPTPMDPWAPALGALPASGAGSFGPETSLAQTPLGALPASSHARDGGNVPTEPSAVRSSSRQRTLAFGLFGGLVLVVTGVLVVRMAGRANDGDAPAASAGDGRGPGLGDGRGAAVASAPFATASGISSASSDPGPASSAAGMAAERSSAASSAARAVVSARRTAAQAPGVPAVAPKPAPSLPPQSAGASPTQPPPKKSDYAEFGERR